LASTPDTHKNITYFTKNYFIILKNTKYNYAEKICCVFPKNNYGFTEKLSRKMFICEPNHFLCGRKHHNFAIFILAYNLQSWALPLQVAVICYSLLSE
jgi:hypothetical protein